MRQTSFIPAWLIPKPLRNGINLIRVSIRLIRSIFYDYGWLRSLREKTCVNRDGLPIPWFTYPAIEFLSQLDLSNRTVFEYGSGASTLFWASRARSVVSVESESEWYEQATSTAPSIVEVLFVSREVEEYAGIIQGRGKFDIIVVDGILENLGLGAVSWP